MNLIGPAIVSGLILAGFYGLLAAGILLAYNTSKVVNLAQGAVAAFAVFALHAMLGAHLPYLLASVVAIAVGGCVGYAMARTTLIPMRRTPPLTRTIATVGWLIILQALAALAFAGNQSTNIPPLFSENQLLVVLGLGVSSQALAILVVAVACAVLLGLFLQRTRYGLAIRAASQDAEALDVLGTDASTTIAVAWTLSGALAAVAGIMVAPQLGAIDATTLTLFVIESLAAALLGGLRHMGRAAVGAVVLGVTESLVSITPLAGTLPGVKFAVPFAFIALVLYFRPQLIKESATRVLSLPAVLPASASVFKVGGLSVLVLFLVLEGTLGAGTSSGIFGDFNRFRWSEVFADSVIFLSLVLLVGYLGQISLCQITFAGFGAFFSAILVSTLHLPFVVALPMAALCCAPIGFLVGLPALRIRGLTLAITTLAFAVIGDQLFFAQSFPLAGGPSGRSLTAQFAGLNLAGDSTNRQMYWIFLGVFAVLAGSMVLFRRSPSGRAFGAVRDSEVAASAMGVSVTRMKLTGFAISAAVAGLGGGLFAITLGTVSSPDFNPLFSVQYLAFAMLAGVRSVYGALLAGALFVWSPVLVGSALERVGMGALGAADVTLLLSGILLVATLIFNPDGIVGAATSSVARLASLGAKKPHLPRITHLPRPRLSGVK
jgi:branched-chain amino acid transport system permease protein